MTVQLLDEITWDGQALLVAAATENAMRQLFLKHLREV
jgi:hypothetical protein